MNKIKFNFLPVPAIKEKAPERFGLRTVALHEAVHAVVAYHYGFKITSIKASQTGGICWTDVARNYLSNKELRAMVSVSLAPSVFFDMNPQYPHQSSGFDTDAIKALKYAQQSAGSNFQFVLDQTRKELERLLKKKHINQAVFKTTKLLMRCGIVTSGQFKRAMTTNVLKSVL